MHLRALRVLGDLAPSGHRCNSLSGHWSPFRDRLGAGVVVAADRWIRIRCSGDAGASPLGSPLGFVVVTDRWMRVRGPGDAGASPLGSPLGFVVVTDRWMRVRGPGDAGASPLGLPLEFAPIGSGPR